MRKLTFLILGCIFCNFSNAQDWSTGLNNSGAGLLGTTFNSPIHIFTNNTNIARFSSAGLPCSGLNGTGQGLRIRNFSAGATPGLGEIDIFTTAGVGNGTEIRWGGSGNIAGRNNRFEMHGNYNGLWFNAATGWTEFAHATGVHAFIGGNKFWRIGDQGDANNLSAARRLEVVDLNAQLRLTNGGNNANGTIYTDFLTNSLGNLVFDATGNKVGIETGLVPVGNTLHINSLLGGAVNGASTVNGGATVPGLGAPTGATGLRFEDLRSSSVPMVNPGPGVLSVDASGDVIYVPGGGGNPFVSCTSVANVDLTANSRSNLNSFNLYFLDGNSNGVNQNQVSIGNPCNNLLLGKFDILNTAQDNAIHANSNFAGSITGIKNGILSEVVGSSIANGIVGRANSGASQSIGVSGYGLNSFVSIGIRGHGQHSFLSGFAFGGNFTANSPTMDQNVGVFGFGYNGNRANFGGYFMANTNSQLNVIDIGVYGNGTDWGGYFVGSTITAGSALVLSDSTLKENVQQESNVLSILPRLNPVNYTMKTIQNHELNLASGLQHGFLAQEVEAFYPELIKTIEHPAQYDSSGVEIFPSRIFKAMNYNGLTSLNTKGIIELNQKVENASLSDQSIKTNVLDLNNSLAKVLAMRGVSYDWTAAGQTNYNLDSSNHIGFIAQELQQVDTRLTFVGSDSLLHVEYEKVVPVLVEAIEELNAEVESKDSLIDDLNTRLTSLENCLSGLLPYLCQLSNSAIQANTPESQNAIRAQLSIKLNDGESIVLDQNVPNPFAEQTIINFSIPESVQKAQIHFYNSEGRIIQSVSIAERGLGSLTVFGTDLSSGIYTYTLVADGISVATKKMMKQ